MKVFFSCSARGYTQFDKNYSAIYDLIQKLGHTHLDDYRRTIDPKKVYTETHEENLRLYKQAMEAIKSCDVLVIEVSTHSISMGYLMQQALTQGKPVIALYFPGNKPVFAAGIENDKLQLIEYSLDNLETELDGALKSAQENMDVRFNFFISPAIGRYLDWISKEKKIPRSVYLRALIEQEMRDNREFNS